MTTLARFCAVLIGTPVVVGLLGCGQSNYEETMVQTEARLKQAGKFSELSLVPVVIPDTPCQIRLPAPFMSRTAYRVFAAAAAEGGGSGPKLEELQPPFLKLPDLKMVFQSMGSDDKGSQYPYFCYVAALAPGAVFTAPAPKPATSEPKAETPVEPPQDVAAENKPEPPVENKPDAAAENKPETPAEPKPDGAADQPADKPETPSGEAAPAAQEPMKLADWIKDQLNQAIPGQKHEWEAVEVPTPVLNQPPIPWQRISVEGVQPFQFLGGSSSDFLEKVEGKFVLYMGERDGTTVLLGLRVPKELDKENKTPIDQWALLAAGTLQP